MQGLFLLTLVDSIIKHDTMPLQKYSLIIKVIYLLKLHLITAKNHLKWRKV